MSEAGNDGSVLEVITEYDAKGILREHGISTPDGIVTGKLPEGLKLNFPVVLKVSDKTILHKSDVGGVKAGIRDFGELREEFTSMKQRFPSSEFLIEEMVKGKVEYIVGISLDPVFGHVVMLGSGGIYTELYHDVCFRKLPVRKEDVVDMLSTIKSGRFCVGFRGVKIDCTLLEDLILKLGRMVSASEKMVMSIDLNPVIVTEKEAIVADAKISYSSSKQPVSDSS